MSNSWGGNQDTGGSKPDSRPRGSQHGSGSNSSWGDNSTNSSQSSWGGGNSNSNSNSQCSWGDSWGDGGGGRGNSNRGNSWDGPNQNQNQGNSWNSNNSSGGPNPNPNQGNSWGNGGGNSNQGQGNSWGDGGGGNSNRGNSWDQNQNQGNSWGSSNSGQGGNSNQTQGNSWNNSNSGSSGPNNSNSNQGNSWGNSEGGNSNQGQGNSNKGNSWDGSGQNQNSNYGGGNSNQGNSWESSGPTNQGNSWGNSGGNSGQGNSWGGSGSNQGGNSGGRGNQNQNSGNSWNSYNGGGQQNQNQGNSWGDGSNANQGGNSWGGGGNSSSNLNQGGSSWGGGGSGNSNQGGNSWGGGGNDSSNSGNSWGDGSNSNQGGSSWGGGGNDSSNSGSSWGGGGSGNSNQGGNGSSNSGSSWGDGSNSNQGGNSWGGGGNDSSNSGSSWGGGGSGNSWGGGGNDSSSSGSSWGDNSGSGSGSSWGGGDGSSGGDSGSSWGGSDQGSSWGSGGGSSGGSISEAVSSLFGFGNDIELIDSVMNLGKIEKSSEVKFLDIPYIPTVEHRPMQIDDQWKIENRVKINSAQNYRPFLTFAEANLPDEFFPIFQQLNWTKPTPIQAIALPVIFHGQDFIGIAKTGSGKTAAYLIPALLHLRLNGIGKGPQVLIVTPSRELTHQVSTVCKTFASVIGVKTAVLYGGQQGESYRQLACNPDLICSTPMRLIDLLKRGKTDLSKVSYVVVDEADNLLAEGFIKQIQALFARVQPIRQTVMWSATWPKDVRELSNTYLREDKVRVVVGDSEVTTNTQIGQFFVPIEVRDDRFPALVDILKQIQEETDGNMKGMIFTNSKTDVNELCRPLQERYGYKVFSIHGSLDQNSRSAAIEGFREAKGAFIVTTNLLSRGIDIPDVTHIINYEMPSLIDDYIHRIGRTGRADNRGKAVSIFNKRKDAPLAHKLIKQLRKSGQQVPDWMEEIEHNSTKDEYRERAGRRFRF